MSVQNMGNIATNLKGVMRSLRSWSSEKFGAVTKELELIRKRLEVLNALNDDVHCK
jgi:hypothetical protein